MRTTFLYPLIFFMLIVLPLFLINYDLVLGDSIERSKVIRQTGEKARELLDEIRRSASDPIQIRKLVHNFHERVFPLFLKEKREKAGEIIEKVYRETLFKTLPSHDLAIDSFDVFRRKTETVFKASSGLGLAEGPMETFSRGVLLERYPYDPTWEFTKKMREITRFPLSWQNYTHSMSSSLEQFQSNEGNRAFLFEIFPSQYKTGYEIHGLTTILIDTAGIPGYFGSRTLVESFEDDKIGVAILPPSKEGAMFSKFFEKHAHLKDLIHQVRDKHQSASTEETGEYLIFFGKPNLTLEFQPVVVFPLPVLVGRGTLSGTRIFRICSLLFILSGGFFALMLTFSGKAIRMSVGMVLLGAFFLVGILPMSGVRSISRIALAEKEQRTRQDLTQQLHQKMVSLDTDVYYKQCVFAQFVRNITKKYEDEEILYKEEILGQDLRSIGSMATGLFEDQAIFTGTSLQGFLIVAGPGEFKRLWMPSVGSEQRGQAQDVFRLLFPVAKAGLKYLQKRSRNPARNFDESGSSAISRKPSKLEIEYEVIRDLFIIGIGADILTNLLHFPFVINEVVFNNRIFMLPVPFLHNGYPRYSFIWAWDEEILRETTDSEFETGKKKEPGYRFYWISANEGKLLSSPRGLTENKELFNLAERSANLNLPFQSWIDTASGPAVFECIPSSFFKTKFFAGMLQGSDPSIELKRAFRITMAIGAVLAIGLALFGTALFMAPLRRILHGLQRVSQGDLNWRLADVSRQDEFGTLANAFNAMVAGLREKALLSRFVSSSVRRAVADSGFQAAAREGELREATILFSGLLEFEEFKERHSPQEVFELMEHHLSAMNEAVGKFGGEINKVMGEKILVVFDHQQLGGGEKALEIILNTISEMKKLLRQNTSAQTVIGINSGSVIAGIIGSPNVRLDYTVIGDTVNLASRLSLLAHITSGTYIVLSGSSVQYLPNPQMVEKLPFNRVKGKTKEVEAFLLLPPGQSSL